MTRVRLIHWNLVEGAERAEQLRDGGYSVDYHLICGKRDFRRIEETSPDAIVIDLSRLPTEGREVAAELRARRGLRTVPLVFVGGAPGSIELVRQAIPEARGVTWRRVLSILGSMAEKSRTNERAKRPAPAGYSGTPLPNKLGIKEGTVVALLGAPAGFQKTLGQFPAGVKMSSRIAAATNLVIWFTKSRKDFARLEAIAANLAQGSIWIAWPKKASGVVTDLTENVIRDSALALGLVDYKVCAIDQTWSGLLLTRRKVQ